MELGFFESLSNAINYISNSFNSFVNIISSILNNLFNSNIIIVYYTLLIIIAITLIFTIIKIWGVK